MTNALQHGVREAALCCAKILIVDDDPMEVEQTQTMLAQAGYSDVQSTNDPCDALALSRAFEPDLILLDMVMPKMDGTTVLQQLKAEWQGGADIPVLMMTADISRRTKQRALACGAKDFLTKPVDSVELLLRIGNLLETRFLYKDLQQQNHSLEDRVRERTAELEAARQRIINHARQLEEAQSETLDRLACAGEFRDDETGQHALRVGMLTAMIARRLGVLPERLPWLQQATRLHDLGKIGIPDHILLKPGRLTDDEFVIMKTHTTIGAELLEGGRSELFQMACHIAASHHERWDGSGYPNGLRGDTIPLEARIVALADVFDALTHDRPYKSAWTVVEAAEEIRRQSGRQFDPQVVDEFLYLLRMGVLN